MPFTQNEQTTLWYTDRGSGPPVLLVHGGLFDPIDGQRFWELPGVVDQLVARGYRVLVPDRRYSIGQTSTPFDIYSWEKEATDFVAVLRAANIESASVIAGSNGCSAAIHFALASSALVRALVLCWPVTPKNDWLRQDLDRCADLVEQVGPTLYLEKLREHGVPCPGEERSGFSFGFALLHDERLAASFCSLPAHEAARTMRESGHALLSGNMLRGVSAADAAALARQPFPIWVMPALPENPVHTLEIAQKLAGHLTRAHLLPGFPETPTPRFAVVRTEFCTVLQQALEDSVSRG